MPSFLPSAPESWGSRAFAPWGRRGSVRGFVRAGAACVGAALVLTGCRVQAGPPPVVEEPSADVGASLSTATSTATTTAAPDPTARTEVSIGVDALRGGLNPHLVANNSQLVDHIADLVLPSPFHGGVMDADLMRSAQEVPAPEGVAQRVRYELSSAAQWSDGTPISAADFAYLWRNMVSTPGVRGAAPYRAIAAVTGENNGRVIVVDFNERVQDWQQLFAHLLPSHVLMNTVFSQALADGIPASAGRYSLSAVDRARGEILLNRNDRYWGSAPAAIDIVRLREMRTSEQTVDMIRSGQVSAADITPSQTTAEWIGLVEGAHVEEQQPARQLRLSLVLADAAARDEVASALDTAQIARLATGRTAPLLVPYGGLKPQQREHPALAALTTSHPVRIAADPTDPVALAAANVAVAQLEASGVEASVVAERLGTIVEELIPAGKVDAVLSWEDTAVTPAVLASSLLCAPVQTDSTSPQVPLEQELKDNAQALLGGSPPQPAAVSGQWGGACTADVRADMDPMRQRLLSGQASAEDGLRSLRELNQRAHLYVPLLDESRARIIGPGVNTPSAGLPVPAVDPKPES